MARHGGLRRVAPPTAEQVAALADAMGPLRAFTLTAAWSGLRLECEVARLLAGDVSERRGVLGPASDPPVSAMRSPAALADDVGLLHVRSGKGGKERHSVLFEPGLSALLEDGYATGHVFRNSRGNPWTRQAVNRHWQKARRRCGLEHVIFHDLRVFHATWLLDRGVSEMDVALQLGHTDRMGRPNTALVRERYGWPDPIAALERVAAAA
jgi:integrase